MDFDLLVLNVCHVTFLIYSLHLFDSKCEIQFNLIPFVE